jgi:hypothetical protein
MLFPLFPCSLIEDTFKDGLNKLTPQQAKSKICISMYVARKNRGNRGNSHRNPLM